jgi:hypothetical protein
MIKSNQYFSSEAQNTRPYMEDREIKITVVEENPDV